MAGYSEVINVMGAMIIFSMILLNANSLIMRNTMMQVEGELEQEVIALGQEIIEEALSKSFDEVTHNAAAPPSLIPEGFTHPSNLGPDPGETDRRYYNDFDDYHGYESTFVTEHGEFEISVEVFYVEEQIVGDNITFVHSNTQTTYKKIEVTVTNEYLTRGDGEPVIYKLEFVRNYYAD
jgi:hypothetical protein